MTTCISTGEYVWRIVLAFVVFWFGLLIFMAALKGKIRFQGVQKLETSKRLAKAVALVAWIAAFLTLVSTLFGWGC